MICELRCYRFKILAQQGIFIISPGNTFYQGVGSEYMVLISETDTFC